MEALGGLPLRANARFHLVVPLLLLAVALHGVLLARDERWVVFFDGSATEARFLREIMPTCSNILATICLLSFKFSPSSTAICIGSDSAQIFQVDIHSAAFLEIYIIIQMNYRNLAHFPPMSVNLTQVCKNKY